MSFKYTNESDRIQIVKISLLDQRLERVIFPQESLTFEHGQNTYLEIYSYETITMILSDKIHCFQLGD